MTGMKSATVKSLIHQFACERMRHAVIASDARNALLRPVLLASFSRRLLVERPTRTENVVVFICVQYSTEAWLPEVARKLRRTSGADLLRHLFDDVCSRIYYRAQGGQWITRGLKLRRPIVNSGAFRYCLVKL